MSHNKEVGEHRDAVSRKTKPHVVVQVEGRSKSSCGARRGGASLSPDHMCFITPTDPYLGMLE